MLDRPARLTPTLTENQRPPKYTTPQHVWQDLKSVLGVCVCADWCGFCLQE